MKRITLAAIVMISFFTAISCKEEDDNTPSIYKPRLIESYGGSTFSIYDLRDTANPKFHYFIWNSSIHKFELENTYDTVGSYRQHLKAFPNITDAVSSGAIYSAHVQDRSVDNKTYIQTGADVVASTLSDDHPGIPARWTKANKTDAYVYINEAYEEPLAPSIFYFDFEAGEYLFYRITPGFTDNQKITDLIKTPNGNMTTDPIDWTLADAAFSFNDDRYTNEVSVIVFDYDTMKYVQFSRKITDTGDAGRQTLRTTSWQPISNLISNWPF